MKISTIMKLYVLNGRLSPVEFVAFSFGESSLNNYINKKEVTMSNAILLLVKKLLSSNAVRLTRNRRVSFVEFSYLTTSIECKGTNPVDSVTEE